MDWKQGYNLQEKISLELNLSLSSCFLRFHPTAAQTATASFVTSEDVLPPLNPLPWAGTILHQRFLILFIYFLF